MTGSKKTHRRTDFKVTSIDSLSYGSRLRTLNPAFKMVFSLTVLIFSVAADSLWVSLFIMLTMCVLTVGFGNIPFRRYVTLMRIPLVFILLGCIAIAFNFSTERLGDFQIAFPTFYLYFTREGLFRTALVFCKAFGAVSALYFLTLSTPVGDLTAVLKWAHFPKIFVELMNLIYRYIFILIDCEEHMKTAAASRLGYADRRTSIRSFGSIAGNLMVISLKKASASYDAMVSRCYAGDMDFYEEEHTISGVQILSAAAYISCMVMIRVLLG